MDLYKPVSAQVNSLNAESNIKNFFGSGKTERRGIFSDLMDHSQQAASDLKDLSAQVSNSGVNVSPSYKQAGYKIYPIKPLKSPGARRKYSQSNCG